MDTDLELILDFVNTLDRRPGLEVLDGPAALAEWLGGHDLLAPGLQVGVSEVADAQKVREAIRVLLLAHNEVEVDETAALETLDAAAARADLCIRFSGGASHCESLADGVDGALGRILARVADAMADGRWERLKACRADDCQWAFFDGAKNRSRAWCSMSSCGNRAKMSAFRGRHAVES